MKFPSSVQLDTASEHYSVREKMLLNKVEVLLEVVQFLCLALPNPNGYLCGKHNRCLCVPPAIK